MIRRPYPHPRWFILARVVAFVFHPSLAIGICIGLTLAVPVIKQAVEQVDLHIDRASICASEK